MLVVEGAAARRRFPGAGVEVGLRGTLEAPPRRVPGALAALHQDRAQPWLPARVLVRAGDGIDRLELEFRPRAAAQLIAGDPARRGYGFIHELVGEFDAVATLAGERREWQGLGVFEYVD
jgi:hypothetical protein